MGKSQQTTTLLLDTPITTTRKGHGNEGVKLDAPMLFLCDPEYLAVTPLLLVLGLSAFFSRGNGGGSQDGCLSLPD